METGITKESEVYYENEFYKISTSVPEVTPFFSEIVNKADIPDLMCTMGCTICSRRKLEASQTEFTCANCFSIYYYAKLAGLKLF